MAASSLPSIAKLDPPVEWMELCLKCESEQRFVAGWDCDSGLLVFCSACGKERIEPFKRTNSEVWSMESAEIFEAFVGTQCAGCGGTKQKRSAFCLLCYRQLPKALKSCLWKRFGAGFEEAYHACLSWFREHPLQGAHRAKQKTLFEENA